MSMTYRRVPVFDLTQLCYAPAAGRIGTSTCNFFSTPVMLVGRMGCVPTSHGGPTLVWTLKAQERLAWKLSVLAI